MQTRRLAASFDFYWVCRAYRTGEILAQSHMCLGFFILQNPRKQPDAKELRSSLPVPRSTADENSNHVYFIMEEDSFTVQPYH